MKCKCENKEFDENGRCVTCSGFAVGTKELERLLAIDTQNTAATPIIESENLDLDRT